MESNIGKAGSSSNSLYNICYLGLDEQQLIITYLVVGDLFRGLTSEEYRLVVASAISNLVQIFSWHASLTIEE